MYLPSEAQIRQEVQVMGCSRPQAIQNLQRLERYRIQQQLQQHDGARWLQQQLDKGVL